MQYYTDTDGPERSGTQKVRFSFDIYPPSWDWGVRDIRVRPNLAQRAHALRRGRLI